jgi:hypothetical protein
MEDHMSMIKQFTLKTYLLIIISFTILTITNCSGMLDIPDPNKKGAGVTIKSPGSAYSVSEANGKLNLTIVLNTLPTANVTIPLASSSTADATVSPDVTFTPSNWDTPQTITITGVDNFIVDGNRNISLQFGAAISDDADYKDGVEPSIPIVVIDNESYSVVVTPSTLITTEPGVSLINPVPIPTATFAVVLGCPPGGDVIIPAITSSNLGEGTVSPANLTFTNANWNTPQVVTVTAVEDLIIDGNVTYSVTLANSTSILDPRYNGLTVPSVTVTNKDNDVPGIVVTTSNTTPAPLNLTEGGAVGTFTVVLTRAPVSGNVTIPITSPSIRATVSTAAFPVPASTVTLTFTPANYNVPQTVTVTPVNNSIKDGDTSVVLDLGIATNYNNENPPNVTVNITDDDTAGFIVSNLSNPTTDRGTTATFTVKLRTQPINDVTVNINEKNDIKNNVNQLGTVDKTSLTFTSATWNVNQTVTVTGVMNYADDDNVQYIIQLLKSSADPVYNDSLLTISGVTVNHDDTDTAGFTLIGSNLVTDHMGNLSNAYSTFTIQLNSQPTGAVTLDLTSSLPADGCPDKSQLIFTTTRDVADSSYNMPQTVRVHILNCAVPTPNGTNPGDHNYSVNWVKTTTDVKYTALTVPGVAIHSCDDFTNLIVGCWAGSSLTTSEGGGKATIWFLTKNVPGSDVSITGAVSNDATEGTVNISSGTITSANYNSMLAGGTNRVEVTGVDDAIFDGNVLYQVTFPNTSTGGIVGQTVPSVNVRNTDNETAFAFNTTGSINTTEAGGSTTFGIHVAGITPPIADVTFTLACQAGSTECAGVSPATMTFTTGNWNVDQIVTITGKDDTAADGNQPNCVSFGPLTTLDPYLTNIQPPDFCGITNTDDDRRIFVSTSQWFGNFNATVDMSSADNKCATDGNYPGSGTYKVLLAHTAFRVATTNGTNATGQSGWVLQPSTKYYLKVGGTYNTLLFTTNAFSLTGFPLSNAFSSLGADQFWTGFNTNWTTSTDNCGDWSQSVNGSGIIGQFGVGGTTSSNAISSGTSSCEAQYNIVKHIICVQQ